MIIHVLNESGVALPVKGSPGATGHDIIATSGPRIVGDAYDAYDYDYYTRVAYIEYSTSLKIAVRKSGSVWNGGGDVDYDALVFPRSGVSKQNLILANSIGLVDGDYRGEVFVRFKYIFQPTDLRVIDTAEYQGLIGKVDPTRIYSEGDAIAQFKITKNEDVEFQLVDSLDETIRADGAFGSTDQPKVNLDVVQAKHTVSQIAELYAKQNTDGNEPIKTYSQQVREREIQ
jgi:hypothetical protein